jgi:DNA-binding NtrC family response regulator
MDGFRAQRSQCRLVRGGRRVLHLGVDDAFGAAGLGVLGVLCWREADHLLASRPQDVCALVTDVELGEDLTGWALARRARLVLPRLPVVYASGCGGHDFAAEAVADARFISKAYAPDYLAHVTCALMDGV